MLKSPFKPSFQDESSISLPSLLPKIPENKIFYQNGLSKIIDRLHVKVHSSLEQCYALWEEFSPKKSLFDLWDFRYAWFEGYQFTPYFYAIYEGKTPLALLPLWYDDDRKRYEWFGSDWMEDNDFFVTDEDFINVLLKLIPKSMYLNGIEQIPKEIVDDILVCPDDDKYFKNIKNFKTMGDYLLTLDKKHRYNLKRDYHHILGFVPRIEVSETDSFDEFKLIVSLSNYRFNGEGEEESDLVDERRVEAYRGILSNSGIYKTKFIKVFIQDYLAAVDLNVVYKDRYYTLRGGNDVERFPGIGNFMVYLEFEDAIKNQYSLVDCLQVDYSWKHKYFDSKKLLEVKKIC